MIYEYKDRGENFPAPCLEIVFSNPISSDQNSPCDSLLDTGADCTLVPSSILKQIKVKPIGKPRFFAGYGGRKGALPYVVSVSFNLNQDREWCKNLEVYEWTETFALIGRDILNQHCLELNGIESLFRFIILS
ncbi:MAG: hypothetical protein AB4290_06825 [Spirulina sp.]